MGENEEAEDKQDLPPERKLLVALTLLVDVLGTGTASESEEKPVLDLKELEDAVKNIQKQFPGGVHLEYPPDWKTIKPKGTKPKKCPHCGKAI